MKTENKIILGLVGLAGLFFLFRPKAKAKLPALEIIKRDASVIEFKIADTFRRIKKNEQQAHQVGKYVLAVLSDISGATFTLYDEDKIIHKYSNAFFTT